MVPKVREGVGLLQQKKDARNRVTGGMEHA
jgi:hypothetical protein